MKKILEYKILSESTIYGLTSAVQAELTSGWQPQGGVSFDGDMYIQALVIYEL